MRIDIFKATTAKAHGIVNGKSRLWGIARVPWGLALALAAVLACRDRESLGSFEESRRMVIVHGCSPRDFGSVQSADISEFRCKLNIRSSDSLACSCQGSAMLQRAANGRDAGLLQLQISHCPHDEAVSTLGYHISWLLAESGKDPTSARTLAKLQRDLDEPTHDASLVNLSETAGNASAVRLYGDRVVEIAWSRDAYQLANGSIEPQPTESYFVAVRPQRKGDTERVTSAGKEPRVTAVPVCD